MTPLRERAARAAERARMAPRPTPAADGTDERLAALLVGHIRPDGIRAFLAGPEVQWHDCLSILAKQCVPQRPRERLEDNDILTAVDEAARRVLAYETDPPRHLEQDRRTNVEADGKYRRPRNKLVWVGRCIIVSFPDCRE